MRLLRTIGASAVAALAVLAAPGAQPAQAQAPTVVVNPGSDGVTFSAPAALSGSMTMTNGGTLNAARVTLASLDGHSAEGATHTYTRGGSGNSPIFSSPNNSSAQFSLTYGPRYNGAYTIAANGTGTDPFPDVDGEQTSSDRTVRFNIEIPPKAPSGVSAALDAGTKKVTITWKANAEPDMVGYQVQRAYGQGSYKEIGVAGASANPKYVDDLSNADTYPPGQYKYRVVAIRKARTCTNPSSDAACNRGITSGASADDSVTMRSQTTTTSSTTTTPKGTTTTVRGGSGGGSGGGGDDGTPTDGRPSGNSTIGSSSGVPGGKVDLSDLSALLNGKGVTTHVPDRIDEGTYDPTLTYGDPRNGSDSSESDPGTIEIGGRTIGPLKTSDDWVKFLGAGSLATALLVHVLWFKGQVDNFPLETVAPQD